MMGAMRELKLALFSVFAVAACGGGDKTPDARHTIDGPRFDGADIDAAPDAGPATFSGTVSLAEVSIQGIPQLGQGLNIDLRFAPDGTAPVFDDNPGSPTGCKVWVYDAAEATNTGQDEGTVSITSADGTPVIPPCVFTGPTTGYLCLGEAGTGGTIAPIGGGAATFTSTSITDAASEVGRYLIISGAAMAGNNGAFPIVNAAGANTVVIGNPGAAAETLPAAANFTAVAGQGPIPGAADPGFLEDDDDITIALTQGGAGDFESFSKSFGALGGAGDDFTLGTASQTLINAIPSDGSAFSLSCDTAGGGTGCDAGAFGSLVAITTTDSPTAGLPPYSLPPPTTTETYLRCAVIGSATVNVPAEASAFLMTSGATRMQTTFLRANLQTAGNTGQVVANTNIVVGHTIAGFSNP
jgi:hypothetical protein